MMIPVGNECDQKMGDKFHKRRILVFCHYYRPSYKAGGPVKSVVNLVEHLGDLFDFWVVTTDRDVGDDQTFSSITLGEWNVVGKAHVRYLAPYEQGLRTMVLLMRNTPHDLIYMNSFFDFGFTIRPLMARLLRTVADVPVLLAPRGEFSSGALGIKAIKKKLFIQVARIIQLYHGLHWHVTNEYEAHNLREVLGLIDLVHKAKNLSAPVIMEKPDWSVRKEGKLRIIFLSRISRMKNLSFVIEVLRSVKVSVEFSIWGPIEDQEYWERCKRQARQLSSNIDFVYQGTVNSELVISTIKEYDLFFLPTQGENFGHVVIEALSAGTPVLLSNQTPWRNLERDGVGWDFPLDSVEPYASVIELMALESEGVITTRRDRCYEYAKQFVNNDSTVMDYRKMFDQVLSDSGQ